MNEEIMREVFGEDFGVNLNSVNIKIMTEVAVEIENNEIDLTADNVDATGKTFTIDTRGKIDLSFIGGALKNKATQTLTDETTFDIAYVGNDIWLVYQFTNNDSITNPDGLDTDIITFTDTIPSNFTLPQTASADNSSYDVDSTSPQTGILTIDGQTISIPATASVTIPYGKRILICVKVSVTSIS